MSAFAVIRSYGPLALAVALLGCASQSMRVDEVASKSAPFKRHAEDEAAAVPAYLLLADGTLHTGSPPPSGLYIEGFLDADRFVPTGRQIEGDGPIGHAEGTPGWMELATGQFFGAMTARAPARPYVEGTMTEEGFVPSSRDIVY